MLVIIWLERDLYSRITAPNPDISRRVICPATLTNGGRQSPGNNPLTPLPPADCSSVQQHPSQRTACGNIAECSWRLQPRPHHSRANRTSLRRPPAELALSERPPGGHGWKHTSFRCPPPGVCRRGARWAGRRGRRGVAEAADDDYHTRPGGVGWNYHSAHTSGKVRRRVVWRWHGHTYTRCG